MRFANCGWVALAAAMALAGATEAARIPQCRGAPSDVTAVDQTVRACLAQGRDCQAVDHLKIFQNREHRLPRLQAGQGYREARVGQGPHGTAGARRIVVLIEGRQGAARVLDDFYTSNHYEAFCELKAGG